MSLTRLLVPSQLVTQLWNGQLFCRVDAVAAARSTGEEVRGGGGLVEDPVPCAAHGSVVVDDATCVNDGVDLTTLSATSCGLRRLHTIRSVASHSTTLDASQTSIIGDYHPVDGGQHSATATSTKNNNGQGNPAHNSPSPMLGSAPRTTNSEAPSNPSPLNTPSTPAPNTPSTPAPNTPSTPAPNTPTTPIPNTPSTPAPNTPTTPIPTTPTSTTASSPSINQPVFPNSLLGGVVLQHGMINPALAYVEKKLNRCYFNDVKNVFFDRGYDVLVPRVPPMGHVEDRAVELKRQILEWDYVRRNPDDRLVVVGHSMGGLDARYMISHLHGDHFVKTLCTVGTPHRGSAIADYVQGSWGLSHVSRGLSLVAIACLTAEFMEDFNRRCPDSQNVDYFSVSGYKGPDVKSYAAVLRITFPEMFRRQGPNDGIVAVESAQWGRHIGTYELDHVEQINAGGTAPPWEMWDHIASHILSESSSCNMSDAVVSSPTSSPQAE